MRRALAVSVCVLAGCHAAPAATSPPPASNDTGGVPTQEFASARTACDALRAKVAPPPVPGSTAMAIETRVKSCTLSTSLPGTLELRLVESVPAHLANDGPRTDFESVYLAPAFRAGGAGSVRVAVDTVIEGRAVTSMSVSGDGDATLVERQDHGATSVFVFRASGLAAIERRLTSTVVVSTCAADGTWCTDPHEVTPERR